MQRTVRSLPLLLALVGLSQPLPASQVGSGDKPGNSPAGGTYSGPGDTVGPPSPAGPNAPPPFGGPGDTGAAGGAQPTPPTAGPAPGAPPPGTYPGGLPESPSTPDARPMVADPSSWELWWFYNRWDYLPVGRVAELLSRTGSESFFLGRGQRLDDASALRAGAAELDLVRPVLLEILQEARPIPDDLIVYALQALARLPEGDPMAQWDFDAAARHYLKHGGQRVPEGSLLALGIRGDVRWTSPLVAVLRDTDAGRELLGRSRIGPRLRAFAAYSLALLAHAEPDGSYRSQLYQKLDAALPDERPEVQAAVLIAMGHCGLPPASTGETPIDAAPALTRDQQVARICEFLADPSQSDLARSQAPQALALLAWDAPEGVRAAAIQALLPRIGVHARESTEVKNGVVQALGAIGLSHDSPLDQELRSDLQGLISNPGADRLTRYLALVSLGRAAGRAGYGDLPLHGLQPTRRFLLRQLSRARGMHLAWTALALGVLEFPAQSRGQYPHKETLEALRASLQSSRNGEVVGAVALSLGMLGDIEASDSLLERIDDSRSRPLQSYAALGIGMIGADGASPRLRELLNETTNVPDALQRVAIALSLLGDVQAGATLRDMLLAASVPQTQASLAAALGWVKDPRVLPQLAQALEAERSDRLRSWIAVAVGRIAEPTDVPWNTHLMVGVNYAVALPTLRDEQTNQGVLDYP